MWAQCSFIFVICNNRGAQVLPQAAEWVILPAAERRFFGNSAESRRLTFYWSRRLMKNLWRSSQNNFTMPQKTEKNILKIFWTSFQT